MRVPTVSTVIAHVNGYSATSHEPAGICGLGVGERSTPPLEDERSVPGRRNTQRLGGISSTLDVVALGGGNDLRVEKRGEGGGQCGGIGDDRLYQARPAGAESAVSGPAPGQVNVQDVHAPDGRDLARSRSVEPATVWEALGKT